MDQFKTRFVLPASKRLGFKAGKPRRGKRSGMAGRPTAEELERRKKRVIEVATALFVERGYAATALVDIASLAGVATRTVYQHFGDKEAIFREVVYARDVGMGMTVERPHVNDGDTLFDALRRAADYAYEVTFHPPSMGLFRLMIAESNRFPDFMRAIGKSIHARFLGNLRAVFEELETAGLIARGDHARSAELFADTCLGSHPIMIYTGWILDRPSAADLDERIAMFIAGRFGPAVARTARTRKAKPRKTAATPASAR